jgi:hypothetical protein
MDKYPRFKPVLFDRQGGAFRALELRGRSWILLVATPIILARGMTLTVRAQSGLEEGRTAGVESVATLLGAATTEVRLGALRLRLALGAEDPRAWGPKTHGHGGCASANNSQFRVDRTPCCEPSPSFSLAGSGVESRDCF